MRLSVLCVKVASKVRYRSCVKTFWAVGELGESHLNNAEQAQFDVLSAASLELILRSL
jgi:hypothetical protein